MSVGEEDHVKPAVEAEGRLNMWQIAVKPGKPLAFGEVDAGGRTGAAFFLGLPGNPVSSFVTFLLFVRPFILRLQGVARRSRRRRIRCAPISTGPRPTAATNSCARASTPPAASTCSPTRVRAC